MILINKQDKRVDRRTVMDGVVVEAVSEVSTVEV